MTQDMKHLYKIVSFLLLLMVFSAGVNKAWGQDFSGIWYIDNNTDHNQTSDKRWYLVPAGNSQQPNGIDAYYSPNHNTTNGDEKKPFLTTYKTNKDFNSVWVVTPSTTSGYYYVIHVKTGKYVIYEPPLPNDDKNQRKSMHLQDISDDGYALDDKDDYNFTFSGVVNGNITICPKNRSGWYWNPAGNNANNYYGTSSPLYRHGLVGIYDNSTGNSIWHFESALLDAPTISDMDDNNKVTVTDNVNNGLPGEPVAANSSNGYHIRYTFSSEGTPADPTASSDVLTNGEYSVTTAGTLKVVIERYGVVLTAVATKNVSPIVTPDDPIITLLNDCSNEISIGPVGPDYYYTIDGSEPSKTNGIPYTEPFQQNTSVTIRAIAYNRSLSSNIVTYNHTARTTPPVITVNGNEVSISGSGTIYYTTDGEDPTVSDEQRYTSPFTLTQATGHH